MNSTESTGHEFLARSETAQKLIARKTKQGFNQLAAEKELADCIVDCLGNPGILKCNLRLTDLAPCASAGKYAEKLFIETGANEWPKSRFYPVFDTVVAH